MTDDLKLPRDFPARKAADRLCDVLIEHLTSERPEVGESFVTDSELVRRSGLSRSTVRRAMSRLDREGWIERHPGKGSYVGPRAALAMPPRKATIQVGRNLVRLAVLSTVLSENRWFCASIIDAMDRAAEDRASIELVGDRSDDLDLPVRRVVQSRPDALVSITSFTANMLVVGAAQRAGIPVVMVGSPEPRLSFPCIYENAHQGMGLAVEHLLGRGHQRIGLILEQSTRPWVFRRREGYISGLERGGVEPDQNLTVWLPESKKTDQATRIAEYIRRRRPSAVIAGHWNLVQPLAAAIRRLSLRIPQDISVVVYDQAPAASQWLGLQATCVAQPLEEFGRRAVTTASRLADGLDAEHQQELDCTFVGGESVGPPKTK